MLFGGLQIILYLCSMKRIEYAMPIDCMRGNLSGRQDLVYDGKRAYSIAVGDEVSADSYQPRIVAKFMKSGRRDLRYFQVRTNTTINMSASMQLNLALMGGAGALFASLVRSKESQIYSDCLGLVPAGKTLRAFMIPLLREGLRAKNTHIAIGNGVYIVNPWTTDETPNVPIEQTLIVKFVILR